jgi:hypothetical protein
MLNLQHQHNNHTTTPHMRVDPTHWGPLSCEGLLCGCCDGVVYESNPYKNKGFDYCTTSSQQLYNNLSHEGGSQCVELILMWEIIVQLLYWCCKSNIYPKGKVKTLTYSFKVHYTTSSSLPRKRYFLKSLTYFQSADHLNKSLNLFSSCLQVPFAEDM